MKLKKNKKQASPIRMPKAPKKAPIEIRKKKFQLSNIFQNKNNKKNIRRKKSNPKYLLIPLIFLVFVALIFFAVKYVLFIRQNAYSETTYEITDVVGLKGIPTYGGSQFLFENNMDDPVVKEFISNGNSAYRLPEKVTSKDIENYYSEKLKALGWEFIQSVPLGTPDKKYGQYWLKDGKGLRIYSKFNDIWYETISEDDARNALANLIKEEIEREMLMASSDKQTLLPDYPWKIDIPKEYLIKYSPTELKDLRAVFFQKMGSTESVEIYPIGKWKTKELDFFLDDYCKTKSTDDVKYGVINSVPISFRDTLGLKSTVQMNSEIIPAYTIANTFNSTVYIITSTQVDSPLLQYIIENIKPLGAKD